MQTRHAGKLLVAVVWVLASCAACPRAETGPSAAGEPSPMTGETPPAPPPPTDPATPPPATTPPAAPPAAPLMGQPCGQGDVCAPDLECVKFYGIAGAQGGQLTSCEKRCDAKGLCPAGLVCTTIADGPGQVCRPSGK